MERVEIWRSLNTDSLQIARRLLPAAAARLELMFEDARSKGDKDVDLTLLKPLDDDVHDFNPRTTIAPKSKEASCLGVTLREAYERYLSDPTNNWSGRTRETYDLVRKLMVFIIGIKTATRSCSDAQCTDIIQPQAHYRRCRCHSRDLNMSLGSG